MQAADGELAIEHVRQIAGVSRLMDANAVQSTRHSELWAYFALAYLLTWAVHIPLAAAAQGYCIWTYRPGCTSWGPLGRSPQHLSSPQRPGAPPVYVT